MKFLQKTLLLLLTLLPFYAGSQRIIRFKISKPYCLVNFMETLKGSNGTSSTLRTYIRSHIPESDSAFYGLAKTYRHIELDYNFTRQDYPEHRRQSRSTQDLILTAAVKASDIDDFNDRTIGILPNSDQQKLIHVLKSVEPYYDSIIWNQSREAMEEQVKTLDSMQEQVNIIFHKLRAFYNSSWSNDFPFVVSLYPIPEKKGITTAQPFGNALAVGTLTDGMKSEERMAVVIHEMAHVLYDEQSIEFQHFLEQLFLQNKSPYSSAAYAFIDEALATACGNGWAFERIMGRTDTTDWYNNSYIDGFAHAIYPRVKEYIDQGRAMDSVFVNDCILLFEQTFPQAIHDYNILLNKLHFYHDGEDALKRNEIGKALREHFQSYSIYSSVPVDHENSLVSLEKSSGTQLILLFDHFEKNLALLRKLFPERQKWLQSNTTDSFILSFYDQQNRPVIIVKVSDYSRVSAAFETLKKQTYMDPEHPYTKIN